MSEQIYVFTLLVISGTFVVVFGMRYLASRQDARARTSKEEAYRELSSKAVQVQGDVNTQLAGVDAELSAVSARLAAVEKMLRDVG